MKTMMNQKKLPTCVILMLMAGSFFLSTAHADTAVELRIGVAPPPARLEYRPPPRRGHIWIPGYWAWDGRHHVWTAGHWERERRGYRYVEPHWEMVGNQWQFYPGYWAVVAPPVAPAPPPAYVERGEPPAAAPNEPNYWYYCNNPAGYYPSVKQCPDGWQKVPPRPPSEK